MAGLGNKPGLAVMDHDQAARGELQLFDQFTVADACRMDMQGCGGAHGIASLCGEE
jgi:hypothetical protein